MDSNHISCGLNTRQFIDGLPQAQDEVDKLDCSLVITMLNGEEMVFASRRTQRQVQTCASSVDYCVDTNDPW